MYTKGFYIENNVGNNAFSFDLREQKRLYVPSLISSSIDDIRLGKEVCFEDYDFDGKLQSCRGLENFYRIKWKDKEIILFDNHNHAFYFWLEARKNGIIKDNNILFHIDEHSDMRVPENILELEDYDDLEKVFKYTNFELNVGNYIVPAVKTGFISEVIQIRNDENLNSYILNNPSFSNDIILNLDLDFFEPNLDYIDYDLKKKVILDIAKSAKVITVATSPFFIDQNLALKVFKDLFGK